MDNKKVSTNNLQRAAMQQQQQQQQVASPAQQPRQQQQANSIDPKFVPLLQEMAASPDTINQELVTNINYYGTREENLKELLKRLYSTVRTFIIPKNNKKLIFHFCF